MNNLIIEEKLNEISMSVMMADRVSPADALSTVTVQLQELLTILATEPTCARLSPSAKLLLEKLNAGKSSKELDAVSEFSSKALTFLKNDSAQLFGEENAQSVSAETNGQVEPEFLVEFIEKHLAMMDELEAWLMEFTQVRESLSGEKLTSAVDTLQRQVKGYIHNIKGDAGSIGLTGIERVCHFVEDMFTERSIDTVVDPLLNLKGWTVECMKAFQVAAEPPESSEKFMARFVESIQNETAPPEPATAIITMENELPSEANLDLLAELMSTGVVDNRETAPPTPAPAPAAKAAPAAVEHKKYGQPPGTEYSLTGEPEILMEFLVEAEDHLTTVETTILESAGNYEAEAIGAIFRSIHSIKGSSSYFGLKEVTESSHVTENLLDEVRDGKRTFDQGLTALVLAYLDLTRSLFANARKSASEGSALTWIEQTVVYLSELDAYYKGEAVPARAATPTPAPAPAAKNVQKASAQESAVVAAKTSSEAEPAAAAAPSAPTASGEKLDVKTFIKVDTKRLDQLIDAIGELGIYSSMLIQRTRSLVQGDENLMKVTHQVEKVTRDVQNISMSMRLIPIRGLFQKMSRLVWDLGKKVGKDIKFSMEGEDTELDRTIIDKLADPLMHMIRNALDHGVEPPEERVQKGKSRTGKIKLSAFHSGGSIHIRIEDDGRGMDPDRLIKKAVEKGILRPDQKLERAQAFDLIFAAGFSTAAVVTDVSGRGVGMDVVKRNIESMRGRVHIQSELGKGTIFTIELPLTLAIMDGIVVGVGSEQFIVPLLSVVEFIKPDKENLNRTFDKGETFYFRGKYLPIFRLAELFNIPSTAHSLENANFVILECHGEQYALLVDEIVGTYTTVIKNLGSLFEQGRGVAGCAIMSHGDIALILDVRTLLLIGREKAAPQQVTQPGVH